MEEGVMSDGEKERIYRFTHHDSEIEITLEENSITWKKSLAGSASSLSSKSRKSKKVNSHSLDWRYVLAADVNEGKSYLEVYYIEKKQKNIWVKSSRKFYGSESDCKECAQAIKEKLTEVPGRPKRLLVFVNPVSGSAKNGEKIYKSTVDPLLQLANIDFKTVVTQRAGHIKEHLQESDLSQFDGIMVVGGDGTFTEAFTGMLLKEAQAQALNIDDPELLWARPPLPIGIVPAGTGQGMIKAATGTKDVTTAVLHIIAGTTISICSLTVHNGVKFLATGSMLAGYGYFGDAIRESENKRSLGVARYPYGLLKSMIQHRLLHLHVRYHFCNSGAKPKQKKKQALHNSSNNNPSADNQQPITAQHSLSANQEEAAKLTMAAAGAGDGNCEIKEGPGEEAHMENIDISSNVDDLSDQWVSNTGYYRAISIFVLNLAARSLEEDLYGSDGMALTLVKAAAGRFKHMGVILKSFSIMSGVENIDDNVAECIDPDRLEFTLLDHTEESLQKLASTVKRECINVDGDPFTLLHPQVFIRKQRDVMSMYGQRPAAPFQW